MKKTSIQLFRNKVNKLKLKRKQLSGKKSKATQFFDGSIKWISGQYKAKNGKTIQYKSSWELRHMERLDGSDKVLKWEYEPFPIMYLTKYLKWRNYYPDFLVYFKDGHIEMHEVGVTKLKIDNLKEKTNAAIKFCKQRNMKFVIVDYKTVKGNIVL